MKTLFIPVKIKSKVNKSKIISLSKKLPKEISIAYSIQYKDVAFEIKNILSFGSQRRANGKFTSLSKTHKITKLIQVLGCSKPIFPKNTKAVLLISSGKFHAISLAIESKLPIYMLEHDKLIKISEKDIESFKKKQKVSYVKFLNADKIGILVSTKPGQQNLEKALDFKKRLKEKKSYLFISNNIDTREFENFGLNSWVNTACPRLDMENNSIINIDKIKL
jgi:diphthamide biosynthesis enzyme Dph1/Dph2-like protein